MPKDTRRRTPSPVPNAPRIQRRLPDRILDRLDRRRAAGKPTKWTDRSLNAVVKYVSTLPPPPSSLPVRPSRAATEEAIAAARRAGENVKARREREAAEARAATSSSSSSRGLAERLSAAPTYELIAPKRVGIDIRRYTTHDLVGIFKPKFNATIKRLQPFDELDLSDLRTNHAAAVVRLLQRLRDINAKIHDDCIIVEPEWRRFESGLRAIGEISFAGLRSNLRRVVKELELVERAGYFEWN